MSAAVTLLLLDRQGGTTFFLPDDGGARCSTSTCSGSSGTRRSTSWSCPRSGWSPRSSRSSRASRSSATRRSRSRRSASRSRGCSSGRTTCSRSGWRSGSTVLHGHVAGGRRSRRRSRSSTGSRRSGAATSASQAPLLFCLGLIGLFTIGGLSGIVAGATFPSTTRCTTRYYVVAHFHYVLFGGTAFGIFAGTLLLVPEDHRPDVRRAARQAALLAHLRRLQPRPSSPSTCSG